MEFAILASTFEKMEATTKRLELTDILIDLFAKTPPSMISKITYLLQGKIRPDYEGVELGVAEKLAIKSLSKSSGIEVKHIKAQYQKEGDLGRASEQIMRQKTQTTFLTESITIERVYDTLFKIAESEGPRSQDMKTRYISSLLNDAQPTEAGYIIKILLGTLRFGIAENTIMDALAAAFTKEKKNRNAIEHAYNVASDLGAVATAVATKGLEGVKEFSAEMFRPIRPMLAERVRSEQEAVAKMSTGFAAEYKLDGERVQIHTSGKKVEIFSRRLERITSHYPDIVEKIPQLTGAKESILEAEAVAINEKTGEFLPFQELMHRRRKYKIEKAVSEYPIAVNFFDVLYADGKSCMDMPYSERRKMLEGIISNGDYARCVVASTIENQSQLAEFMESAINAGSEGLMLKMQQSPYKAGSRGSHWLKLKKEYQNDLGDSLDLVVIGGFFGKGRRTGIYGTLLLAAYDDQRDMFTSTCKVGTGFTDEDLDRLYQILHPKVTIRKNPRIDSEMAADVWFEPELVVEVVASEITLSPIHKTAWSVVRKDSGLALRFPKYTGKIRSEKSPEDASTTHEIVALYGGQKKITDDAAT